MSQYFLADPEEYEDMDYFVRSHEWLVRTAVFKYIREPALTARIYKMQDDDLFQVARIALWEAARDFDQERTDMQLYSFLFWKIKCRLFTELQNMKYSNRLADFTAGSMSAPIGDGSMELVDVIPHEDYNVERIVVKKLLFEEAMLRLTPREKQIFYLRLDGFTFEEIANILGLKSIGKLPDQLEFAMKKIDPDFTIRKKIKHGDMRSAFVQLYNQGMGRKELCEELGIRYKAYGHYKSVLKDRLHAV